MSRCVTVFSLVRREGDACICSDMRPTLAQARWLEVCGLRGVLVRRGGGRRGNDGEGAERETMCSMFAGAPLYRGCGGVGGGGGGIWDRTAVVLLNNY